MARNQVLALREVDGSTGCAQGTTSTVFSHPFGGVPLPTPPAARTERVEMRTILAPLDDFVASVREAIGTLLSAARLDVGRLAAAFGIGTRTLQRRLAGTGVDFTRLVEDVRLELAVRLLGNPQMKVVEIALDLGYSDHAHFSRAFRQWTGVAPREFRRRRLSVSEGLSRAGVAVTKLRDVAYRSGRRGGQGRA